MRFPEAGAIAHVSRLYEAKPLEFIIADANVHKRIQENIRGGELLRRGVVMVGGEEAAERRRGASLLREAGARVRGRRGLHEERPALPPDSMPVQADASREPSKWLGPAVAPDIIGL